MIFFLEWTSKPKSSLPKVPELPAFKIKLFLYLYPFKPKPFISQKFFVSFTFTPSFFRQFNVLITSSESNKFFDLHFFCDWEDIRAHLIDKLLSPSIDIFLLNLFILLFIFIKLLI